MNILHANKFFFPNGGSETVFFLTRDLLSKRGHTVIDFAMADDRNLPSQFAPFFAPQRHYDGSDTSSQRVRNAAASIYSYGARRQLSRLLDAHPCDIAHLHLIYHQLTMSIVDELARRRIPIVMTAHDYKPACPAYTLFRDGIPCRRCVGASPRHAIGGRCVKGSLSASVVAFAEAELVTRRRLYAKVDQWIAPSRFAAGVLLASGTDATKISVIPNFIPDSELISGTRTMSDRPRFLYAGRFESTKGTDLLLKVFEQSSGEFGSLVMAGATGTLTDAVRNAAARSPHITYLGQLSRKDLWNELSQATATVLPAAWEENCPMSILEARAASVAVVCSDRGGLPDMVEHGVDGLVFASGDNAALRHVLGMMAANPDLAARLGQTGHERLIRENTESAHYGALTATYRDAQTVASAR